MFRSTLLMATSTLVAAVALVAPVQAQASRGERWFLEAGVGALGVRESGASNVTTRGTAPLATLRAGRAVAPAVHLTLSAAYGEVANARHDVYERPAGPTRTETYDYHALLVLAGVEFAKPLGRTDVFGKLEGGWGRDGWRLAEWNDPAGFPAPFSSAGGSVAVAGGVGLRYWLLARTSVGGALRVVTGAGALRGEGGAFIPEVALRWRF